MPSPSTRSDASSFLRALDRLAGPALARMYEPAERMFAFKVTPGPAGLVRAGLSGRYTAIALIGLAARPSLVPEVLGPDRPLDVCGRLIARAGSSADLGEVALTAWAAGVLDHPDQEIAWRTLEALSPAAGERPTVDTAWSLAALTLGGPARLAPVRDALATRLMAACVERSSFFPHAIGRAAGSRSHVTCFADLVYPIHALSLHGAATGDVRAVALAARCAERACALQGRAGQWWWHYDVRTGGVVEGYPVYAIHQDAMAPLALLALERAGGPSLRAHLERGLEWLACAPELGGASLRDDARGMVWRKVARREPGKASRYLQAAAARVHPSLRAPGLDALFPAVSIDFEDRPYHWGWFLHAWAGVPAEVPS